MRKHPSFNRIKSIMTVLYLTMLSVVAAENLNPHNAVFGEFIAKNERSLPWSKRSNAKRSDSNPSGVCHTPGCSKAAEEIASNLDHGANPCDDFYQFSCGGWKDRHQMTDDRPAVVVQSVMQDKIDGEFKDLLGKPLTEAEPDYVRKAKKIYQSCMDSESIEAAGSEPLEKALEILGGWPVVQGWEEAKFDWIDVLTLMRRMGFDHNILLTLSVLPDIRNGSVHIITLDQAVLGLPDRSYLLNGLEDEGAAAYYRMIVQTAEKLGADTRSAETQMMDALNFETALANYSIPLEERENVGQLYNKYTVKTLQEQVPQIDWMKYFNGLLNDPVSEEEPLVITVPNFLFRFADLITKTDKRVVANYVLWRVALQSLPALSEAWFSLWAEHESALSGRVEAQGRDEICLYALGENDLHIALSAIYVRNYFPEESRQGALQIANYIQREIIHTLGNIEWMDQEARRYAKEKAKAMKKYIGYPKELLNDDLVSELYKNLIITDDGNYFKNLMKLRKWKTDEKFSYLRHPNLNGGWKDHVFDMALSRYSYEDNSIDYPAAIVQNPYFDVNRPQYLNFGGIGYDMAYQMTLGFHNKGRQYDKSGNNVNWWDMKTEAKFEKKAECIIQQYGNYTTEHGLKVDGAITLENNVAANAGLKEAYKAYQSWVKEHGPEDQLPGLNYSPNQLFWISAANLYCGKFRAEFLEQIIAIGYTPFQFLVNGPVSQLPEFARDFQCGISTNMNPPNKCQIW